MLMSDVFGEEAAEQGPGDGQVVDGADEEVGPPAATDTRTRRGYSVGRQAQWVPFAHPLRHNDSLTTSDGAPSSFVVGELAVSNALNEPASR